MNTATKTFSAKAGDITTKWYLVDASGATLGRLATQLASILNGKNKATYTPNLVCGDAVVVINAAKIRTTGNKLLDKKYYRHSGYPGGLKEARLEEQMAKSPAKVIEHAVAGMLPKNKLRPVMLRNLKVFAGAEHSHEGQKPEKLELT